MRIKGGQNNPAQFAVKHNELPLQFIVRFGRAFCIANPLVRLTLPISVINKITYVVIFVLALGGLSPANASSADRQQQKRSAESEHADLRKKLANLKQDILKTESEQQRAQDLLAKSETAISDANRKLYALTNEQRATQQKLTELTAMQQQLQRQIERQKQQFSALLRQQYQAGNNDRIKLLLSGDNPNRINRDLQYLGYLSQAQQHLINQLNVNLAAVETNKIAAQQIEQDLQEIADEQQQQKIALLNEKTQRANLMQQLSAKVAAQRKEAGQVQKNEQRLANLVSRLNVLIEQQQKAEFAEQKRKAAQLAKEAKEAKLKATKPEQNKNSNKEAGNKPEPITVNKTPDASNAGAQFTQLKGRLRIPVKGELTAKFGSSRGEGTVWKGIFIRANEGAEIKAIASGKVIFAEWLRGFGNLIIVDHGGQYMSIYGNNEAVLKQAGEQINAGEVIATAGNSGGNEQSGLYFELRFQGKAIDPLSWINLN